MSWGNRKGQTLMDQVADLIERYDYESVLQAVIAQSSGHSITIDAEQAMTHLSAGGLDADADGFVFAHCTCGWRDGPFPDEETTIDALMEHAALMAREEASS